MSRGSTSSKQTTSKCNKPITFVKSTQPPSLLDVYFIVDKPISFDFSSQFKKFISNHNYKLAKISQLPCKKHEDSNILKRGIYNFEKYFQSLKLKSSNTLWFVYVGAEVVNKNRQMNIMMIIENPTYGKNDFLYHISKTKDFSTYMIDLFKAKKRLSFNISLI